MTERPDAALAPIGWRPFFSRQLSVAEGSDCQPVRVMAVHRGMVAVMGDGIDRVIASTRPSAAGPEDRPTVGDWLLIDRDRGNLVRILDRASLVKRPAPADSRRTQLIAANIDTLFVVTSCDQDFNVARIERYLVLAGEAGVRPVVVLTKADLSSASQHHVAAAKTLQPGLQVELIDGRDPVSVARLARHCGPGETVALVGSSGVGKSTIVKTLTGSDGIATQAVRESDGKGLHTTTVRQMHRLGSGRNGGGWLVDTPGMRELQMSDVGAGVAEVFDDVIAVTRDCRFANCTHAGEPGCAVRGAIADGTLSPARVERWRKLSDEDGASMGATMIRRARFGRAGRRT